MVSILIPLGFLVLCLIVLGYEAHQEEEKHPLPPQVLDNYEIHHVTLGDRVIAVHPNQQKVVQHEPVHDTVSQS